MFSEKNHILTFWDKVPDKRNLSNSEKYVRTSNYLFDSEIKNSREPITLLELSLRVSEKYNIKLNEVINAITHYRVIDHLLTKWVLEDNFICRVRNDEFPFHRELWK